ncbi:DUF3435 domain protein [Metarhizium robertsii]|uniref:DUF3435 domain protein n=2 Tax=Metarhizium robertsii TaxID=568076 RepID=E9EJZ2_METRA|nr:uncharacterized protein MAA_01397 [Metarhizium robertsii ARSEF 23]EFZ04323.2 hypothetical protein MAA_01397 [Metarhizium robertsii ARSEF 23]EXU94926.1 DUF3435 domain protein [Metarhizium robertsii]
MTEELDAAQVGSYQKRPREEELENMSWYVEYYPVERARTRRCWVCDDVDERTDPSFHVLCWEDIDLWILRDPEDGNGTDKPAVQLLLRWHKGHNKKIVPTWYLFVEEKHPGLCPTSHILAKALAEKVIANQGYQTSEGPFFNTKLSRRAVKIQLKKEWRHKPVFRQTINSLGEKPDEPLTAAVFDSHSNRLGIALGLSEKLSQYCYRRGYAETVDSNYRQSVRDQGMRHKPNSTVYQNYYHNARMNAVVQDAFLSRGTNSPMLALLNHMVLSRDENAPKIVPEDMMQFQAELTDKYGRPSRASAAEMAKYNGKQQELRTARQKHRGKVLKVIRRGYFEKKHDEELQNQLRDLPPSAMLSTSYFQCFRFLLGTRSYAMRMQGAHAGALDVMKAGVPVAASKSKSDAAVAVAVVAAAADSAPVENRPWSRILS